MSHAAVIRSLPSGPSRPAMTRNVSHRPADYMAVDAAAEDLAPLFERAPPITMQAGLAIDVWWRAIALGVLAWLPLVLLAALQELWNPAGRLGSVLAEVGLHARYLVAVPLFVLAERFCAPQLGTILANFVHGGLVADADRAAFDRAIASTQARLRSTVAEVVVVILAYCVSMATVLTYTYEQLPAWALSADRTMLSLAGWWHALVSLPLLLALCLGWLWRVVLWAQLLRSVARLKLRLIASHPDRCAGLAFLGQSVRAFSIVGMAVMMVAAGRSAQLVLGGDATPTQNFYFNIGLAAVLLVVFVAPLLAFTSSLMGAWRHGMLEYGALAARAGHAFEAKWLKADHADGEILEQPDSSALTDLYQVVANVGSLHFVPVSLKDLAMLVVAMLIPFVPVVLLAIPVSVIMANLRGLLF